MSILSPGLMFSERMTVMIRRFLGLGVGTLALSIVLWAPGQLHAQHVHGGMPHGGMPSFRNGVMPGFRNGVTPGFRNGVTPGFNRSFLDARINRSFLDA